MVTRRSESRAISFITRRWVAVGSVRIVCSVVTTGIFTSRKNFEDVLAAVAAVDAVLVLHAENLYLVGVEEVRRVMVGALFLLSDLKAHAVRVGVPLGPVVHGQREAFGVGERGGDGFAGVGGEGRQTALARLVVAEKSDAMNTGVLFHMVYLWFDTSSAPEDVRGGERGDKHLIPSTAQHPFQKSTIAGDTDAKGELAVCWSERRQSQAFVY